MQELDAAGGRASKVCAGRQLLHIDNPTKETTRTTERGAELVASGSKRWRFWFVTGTMKIEL